MRTAHGSRLGARAAAAIAAMVASGLLAASAGAEALEAEDYAVDATSIQLCWRDADSDIFHTYTWAIRSAAGLSPPSVTSAPIDHLETVGAGACRVVGGLMTDVPYTFRITGDNGAGRVESGTLTAAARVPGAFVRVGADTDQVRLTEGDGPIAVAAPPGATGVDAAFVGTPLSFGTDVYAAHRTAPADWSQTPMYESLTHFQPDRDPMIATNRLGAAVVAWNVQERVGGYRYRAVARGQWSDEHHLVRSGAAAAAFFLDAAAIDESGHLHFLLTRGPDDPNPGVYYRTDATGKWTQTRVPHSSSVGGPCPYGEVTLDSRGEAEPCDRALMAYDSVRDRIAVVQRYVAKTAGRAGSALRGAIRIAQVAANAAAFGRAYSLAVAPGVSDRLQPTSLTVFAGEITLALKGSLPGGTPGLFVAAGTSAAHVGSLRRVPGTNARDLGSWPALHAFLVAANRHRVMLARQRSSPLWDEREQGIWLQERIREQSTRRWRFRSAHHLTSSAYDVLSGLALGDGPAPVVGYTR